MKCVLLLLVLLSSSFAVVQLVTPRHIAIEPMQEVELSPVGPGQEVLLKFERKSVNYVWDKVRIVNVIDSDWETSSYDDFQYIYYSLRVPSSKASGRYTFQFEIIDNEGLKDRETAVVQIVVTHDPDELIEVQPMPLSAEGFAGEEFFVGFNVRNKALSRADYKVSFSFVEQPGLGETTVEHSFFSGETKIIDLPVLVPHEGEYTLVARLWSEDNPTLSKRMSSRLLVKPTFYSKLVSIGRGFPLVPITMAPFYAVFGFFGW